MTTITSTSHAAAAAERAAERATHVAEQDLAREQLAAERVSYLVDALHRQLAPSSLTITVKEDINLGYKPLKHCDQCQGENEATLHIAELGLDVAALIRWDDVVRFSRYDVTTDRPKCHFSIIAGDRFFPTDAGITDAILAAAAHRDSPPRPASRKGWLGRLLGR